MRASAAPHPSYAAPKVMHSTASCGPFAGDVCNHLGLGHEPVDAVITFSDVPAAAPVAVHLTAAGAADPGALYVNMASWKRSVKALAQAADPHAPRQMSIVRTSEPGSTPLALRFTLFTADGRPIPALDVELVVRLPSCARPALMLLQPAHPSDQLSCIQHSC
jgi:hypothetical protein